MWQYNVLEHDGVKNQKWGIRRYQNSDGTYTPLGLERRRAEYRRKMRGKLDEAKNRLREERTRRRENRVAARKDQPRIKKTTEMSDADLRRATERLNLENNYIQAMERRHSGQAYARDTLRQIGRTAATTLASKMTAVAVDALVRQIANVTVDSNSDFGRVINEAANAAKKGGNDNQ